MFFKTSRKFAALQHCMYYHSMLITTSEHTADQAADITRVQTKEHLAIVMA